MSVRRQLVAFAVLIAIVAIYDFASRVHVGRDASLRAFEKPPPVTLAPPETGVDATRRLGEWLPGVVAGTRVVANDPAALKFDLYGVFSVKGRSTAIVGVSQAAGGPPQVMRVAAGDALHGWTVGRVDARSVALQNGAETRELVMFRHAVPRQDPVALPGGAPSGGAIPLPVVTAPPPADRAQPRPVASKKPVNVLEPPPGVVVTAGETAPPEPVEGPLQARPAGAAPARSPASPGSGGAGPRPP